ncbi:MAG: decaprenyl-phosphate phosphoribosyltransferase [Planctomycetota bacterium]|nr:decaprenyl-phosphate phosphoribosyltransferase [Planctomycetota bacterium]
MKALVNLVRLSRPSHWLKNGFVFAALVFARKMTDAAAVVKVIEAFAAFCLASSAIYALNDVVDRREDAQHPSKRNRPVASGAVGAGLAVGLSVVLAAAGVGLALVVGRAFAATVVAYLVLMLAYVAGLKRVAILDVLVIASGFVIRAYAGGVAINVEVSYWLLLCTLTLSLFLGFAKRESERVALGEDASASRPLAWGVYSRETLAHMMTVSAGLAIVTYMLYTVSERTIREVAHHEWMFITVLPVIYAVFRFYHMAITGRAGDPVDMVRRDPAFVIALVVWLAMVAGLLFAV